MNKLRHAALAAAFALLCIPAGAQGSGKLTYSLPVTSLVMDVEAVCEDFHAGPYAQYAKKYLGIEARTEDKSTYSVTRVSLRPYVEADPTCRYEINVGTGSVSEASMLKLTSQGLVSFIGNDMPQERTWRFPAALHEDEFGAGRISESFTSEDIELYRMVKKDGGYQKVAVQQKQVVAKSDEKKAAEVAAAIFNLRKKREEIVTGDTDATFDGEALGAAVAEMTRLEQQYLSLFIGYSECSVQNMSFDLTPDPSGEQVYVAFRVSDTAGLLPSDNMSGRPVVATIEYDSQAPEAVQSGKPRKGGAEIMYRVPAIGTVKVMDRTTLLVQARIPFYQLGQTLSMPVSFVR